MGWGDAENITLNSKPIFRYDFRLHVLLFIIRHPHHPLPLRSYSHVIILLKAKKERRGAKEEKLKLIFPFHLKNWFHLCVFTNIIAFAWAYHGTCISPYVLRHPNSSNRIVVVLDCSHFMYPCAAVWHLYITYYSSPLMRMLWTFFFVLFVCLHSGLFTTTCILLYGYG